MASINSDFDNNHSHTNPDSHRKKRRKIDSTATTTSTTTTASSSGTGNSDQSHVRWRSPSEQQIYSSKLLEALRYVTRRNPPPSGSRAVRDAADKILAIAARGRTRWSRAILSNRMKLRLKSHKKAKIKPKFQSLVVTGTSRFSGAGNGEKQRELPALDKRLKVLGRLVPGCRKLSFPNLLEEATDYIAALQMQVRAMTALAELLTGGSSPGSTDDPVHTS